MKNIFLAFFVVFLSCFQSIAQANFTADFETYDSTPYYFRFGNNSSVTFLPRWKYSHVIADNPLINSMNMSSKVLQYSSLEARWYGLKFQFSAPLNLDDIDTLTFDIFQPANIVGKAVNAKYSSTTATTQDIRVKLLTYFNTIQDSREDAGVMLSFAGAVLPFTTTGQWVKYQVLINPSKFSASDLTKLAAGVVGIAIEPTYNAGVTLQTEHVCYLDNIITRKANLTGITSILGKEKLNVRYDNGVINFQSEIQAKANVNVYDVKGMMVSTLFSGNIEVKGYTFSVAYKPGIYFVSVRTNNRFYNFKIII